MKEDMTMFNRLENGTKRLVTWPMLTSTRQYIGQSLWIIFPIYDSAAQLYNYYEWNIFMTIICCILEKDWTILVTWNTQLHQIHVKYTLNVINVFFYVYLCIFSFFLTNGKGSGAFEKGKISLCFSKKRGEKLFRFRLMVSCFTFNMFCFVNN